MDPNSNPQSKTAVLSISNIHDSQADCWKGAASSYMPEANALPINDCASS